MPSMLSNFTDDKTNIHKEYKQWHKIKGYIPKVLIPALLAGWPCELYPQFKDAFCIFIIKLLIYSFPTAHFSKKA